MNSDFDKAAEDPKGSIAGDYKDVAGAGDDGYGWQGGPIRFVSRIERQPLQVVMKPVETE